MSKLGSLYIQLGEPEGELAGCCETAEWAAGYIESLRQQLASRDAEVAEVREDRDTWKARAEFSYRERDKLRDQVTLLRDRLGDLIDEVTSADDALSSGDKTKALIGVRRASVSASYGKQIFDATEPTP